jgi:gliding motility-associated-like protein
MRVDFSTMKIRSLGIMLLIILSSFVSFSQDATFSSPDATQCPENLFELVATNTTYGDPNYSWLITGPSSFSPQTYTGDSVAAYLTVSGFYNVKLTVTVGGTPTSITQNNFIQVYNKPTISYSVTPTTGCSPLLVTFNGSCTPGSGTLAGFAPNAGDGTAYSTEDFTHTFTSGGSFTPSVTVTNSFGCNTTGNLTPVTVTASPSLTSPLNPNSICSGSTFNYTPTSTISGATYSWVRTLPSGVTGSGSNTSTGTTGVISQTLTNNTSGNLQVTYAMTVTANGCSRTQNVVVTVRALPTVSITQGATLAICTGSTGTLTAAGLPSGGTYLWSTGAATASINVTTAGARSVTYSDGTCSSTAVTSTVSISAPPTISSFTRTETSGTANDGSICPGASAVISATVSAPNGTYLWSTGATTSTITVTPPITTTYSLTYTLGCTATNSTQITVLGLPTPSYSSAVTNFCSPPITTTFTNTSTNAAGGVVWSFSSGNGTPISSTSSTPSVTYNQSGSWSVSLTATSAAGCSKTTVFPNAINIGSGSPPTSLFNATTDLTQCFSSIAAPGISVANNSVCFQYTGTGADTIQVNWGDGSALQYVSDVGTFCHTFAAVGTFTVIATPYTTVSNQLGCAGSAVSFPVTIKGPAASYSLGALDCENQRTRTFTSTTTGASGSATYAWNFGDPSSGVNNTSTLQSVGHTFTQTQSAAYVVRLTVTDPLSTCPASSITTNVFAYPNNTAAFQAYNNTTASRVVTTEVCLNGSLSFYNETPSPQLATQAAHTVWNINNTNATWSTVNSVRGNPNTYNFLETGNIGNFSVDWVPGTYSVSMRNRRDNPDVNNQCFEIETKTNYIKVHGITGTFTVADTVCANASMSVTDNSTAPVTFIEVRTWSWGDGTPNTVVTTNSASTSALLANRQASHTYTSSGSYTITLTTVDDFGCTKETTKQVIVRKPLASFSVDRNFICPGQTVAVTNNSTGLGLTTYAWSALTATPASATGTSPAPFTFPTAGSRSIRLTVTDNLGCIKDSTIAITVQNPVPSATASPSAVSCFNPPTVVNFTNTSTNNVDNTTAVWNFNATPSVAGNGVSPTTSNNWQPSATYSLPGTYRVTLQVSSLTGCTSAVTQVGTVTIGGPSGTVNVTNSNLTGCSCYTATMTVTTSNVTEARLLYGDGQFLNLTPNTTQNVSYSYCNTGTTTITRTPSLYISNGTCNGFIPALQTINIKPTPTVNAISNQLKCAGVNSDAVTFTGNIPSSNIPAPVYTWSRTNTATTISALPLAASGTGDISSFLTDNILSTAVSSVFTVTPSYDGCTGSPTNFTITVGPRPISTVSTTSVCVGGTVTTTPNTGGVWTGNNNSVATVTSSGVVSIIAAGTVTFRYTETTSGCFRDHVLTVNPKPTVTASNSVCVGTTIVLSPSTLGTWTSSSTPTATVAQATGVVTGVAPGTVNFTYTVTATGCSNTTSNVTVNALPIVTLNPTTICQGQTAQATPITGGTWAVASGTGVPITTGGVINSTTLATGPATFEFTQTSTGCKAVTGPLTINPLPTLTSPSSICFGSTGNLTPSTGGTWVSNNTNRATVSSSGVVTPFTPVNPGTVTFTYTQTSTGCARTTSNVTINNVPTVTAPSSICVGATATLSPTSGGTWTSSNTGRATVTNAGVATGVAAGNVTFIFEQTSTTCSSTTSNVTINALPTVTAASTSICIGATTTLTPITGGTWASGTSAVASVDNAGLVTGLTAGTSIMTFTNSTTGCSRSTSAITVNALPTFGTTKTDPTVCNATNGTVTLTGLTASTSYRYTYRLNGVTTGPTTATSNSSGQITVSNLGAGTYTFSVQLVSTSCSSAEQDISLVNPNAPDINNIADQFLCGTTYTLPTITGTNLPGNQVYSSQPGGFGTVYPVGTVISSTTTIYIWTRTPTTGGCSDQESFTVTINSNPVVTAPTSVCVGGTGQLTPTTGVTWTSSNTSRATVTSGGVITGVAAGSVTFTCVDNTTTCSTTTPAVTIVAKPTLSAASFVCVNGTINITPATGGTWSSSDNTIATVTSAGLVTGKVPGTVQFTFTSTTTGCSNTTSDVTVRPQPILTSPASVCMGSTGLLSPISGGTWTSLATGTATVTNTGIISPVAPGNVTFRFFETSSSCSDTTSNVIIHALPVLGGPTQVCVGANINLTPSTGGTWSGGNPLIATISPSGVVNGGAVGNTTFDFLSTATGCTNTSSSITVNPNPTVNGPSQVCVGSTVNYSGGTGFTWSSNNTSIVTVAANGVVTGQGAGSTFLINTNPFTQCFANSAPITVNALPVVTAPASVCVGGTVTLSPTTGGTWSSSDVSKATVSSAGVVEGVAAGSVTFTFTDALTGCSKTTTSLTVISNPIITLSRTNPSVCNGTDGTIRINGLTANTSFQYSYTGPTSAGPITATTNASGQITISGLGAGTYTITATNPVTTCTSAEVIISLTNPNSPNVTVIANQTLCGTTYTLPAITGSNLTNAQYWTGTGGTGTVLPVGTVISTIGTTSICMYSATPGGCSDEECFTVTINPVPVASAPANVCQGQTVTASPTTGGSWAVVTGSQFVSVNNNGVVTGLLPGVATIRFTDGTTNCPSNTVSITVKAVQTVNAGLDQTVCSNSTVTLAGSRGGSATASTWSGGTDFSDFSSLTPTYTLSLGDVGTVSLTLTAVDPTGICPDVSDQVLITIDQAPVISAGLGQTICSNSTVTLGGTLGGVASNATWSDGLSPGEFDNVNSLNAVYTPNVTSGFVTLTLTTSDPAGPCTAVSSTVSITINPVATVSAGTDFVSCSGSPIQLPGVIGGSATSATWSGGNGTYSPDANALTGTYMPTVDEFDNNLTLTLTTNDPVGPCPAVDDNVTITFADPAISTVSPDDTICEGESVNVSGTFGGAASSASWVYVSENGSTPGVILPNANAAAISYQPSATDITNGRVRLIYRTNNPAGPCNAVDDTVNITINRTPFLLNNNTAIGCTGDPINLQLVVGGGLTADFSWFANNNPNVSGEAVGVQTTSLISDVLTLNPGITTNQTVLYTVTPTISASGCVGTPLQISLTVVPKPTISNVTNQLLCANTATQLTNWQTNVVGGGYSWVYDNFDPNPNSQTNIGGIDPTGNGQIPSFIAVNNSGVTQVARIIVTPLNATCPGVADTMLITVLPISTVFDPVDITICAGQTIPSIIFTGSNTNTVYNWTNSNPNINLGTSGTGNILSFTPSNPIPNTETATITVTPSLNGCIGIPQTFTIVVKPTPILQPIANQTVCTGNTTTQVNFNALISGTTFTWTNVNSNPIQNLGLGANGVNFVPAFLALNDISPIIETHTITVTPTFDQCVGSPQTFVITVNPILRADPIQNISICEGLKLTPFTITGNVPGVVYNWTNNNIAINLPQNGTGGFPDATMQTGNFCTTANIVITPVLAGCQGVQTNFTITVCPKPNVYISQQSQGNCHAAPTIPVLFTGDVANTTFTWTNTDNVFIQDNSIYDNVYSDDGDLLSFDGQNTTTNPPTTQTAIYQVYGTSSDGCRGDTSEFTITVDPRPTVNSVPDQSVCPGQPTTQVVFTGNFGTATTYDWSYINTLGSTGIPVSGSDVLPSFSPVYSGSVPVIIPITCTPRFNTCLGTPTTFNLTVKPTPTVNQIADQSLCAGSLTADVIFTGNQNNNPNPSLTVYDWTNSTDQIGQPLIGTGDILSFPVSTLPNTVITSLFEVVPKLNGCIGDTMSFTIQSVSPFPIVDTIPSQNNLCAGQSTNMICFTGGGNPITNYVWTNDNTSIGLASNGTTDPLLNHCIPSFTATNNFLTPQTATITVRPWYLGCQGNARTFTINVKPVPQVFVTPPIQTLCSSDSTQLIQFTGTLTGTNYDWTNNNTSIGLPASGNGNIASFPTSNLSDVIQTATIDCVPSLNGCIGDTVTAFIVVNPVSTVILPNLNYAYCHGDVVPQNCFVGNNPNTTYLWTNSNTNIGLPSAGMGCVPSFTAQNTSLGNDSAMIIIQPVLNGCPGIADTFMIYTKPIPNVYSVADINICAGVTVQSITFQGDMTSTTTFTWSGNTNIGLTPNNGTNTIPLFVGLNSYNNLILDNIIEVTPSRQGCTGIAETFLITVNPVSEVTIADSLVFCNGVVVPPTPINGTSSAAIYTWTNNNISIGLAAGGTSSVAPFEIPSFTAIGGVVPQVATIICTPFVNGCVGDDDTLIITINPTPIVNPVTSQSLCAGTNSNPIIFSGPVANTIFNWSHSNAAIGLTPTDSIGNIPTFTGGANLYPSPDNVATVQVIPEADGCLGDTIFFTLTVHPLPIINAGFDTTLCLGQFIIPQGSGLSIAGSSFGFQWTATPSNASNTTPLNGQPYYPDATTTLSVIGTDMNLCQNVDTLIVTYLQVAPPQVFAGLDTALCFGESISLCAVHDGDLLVWDNGVFDCIEFTPDTTNTYIATASHINDCYSKDTIVVTVNPLPIITANASDDFICDGDSTLLWGDGAGVGAVYTWDNSVIDSVGFIPLVTNTYEVIGTDINGCKDTADIVVTVNPNPVVLFSSNITFGGCLPFSPTFYDLSSPTSASVTWDFGDGNTSSQLDSAINIYDNYGCYDVTLTSTTPEGCSTSLTQQDFVCVNEIIADFEPDTFEQPISNPIFEFNNTSQNATSYQWFFGDNDSSYAVHPDHTYDEIGLYAVTLVASAQDGCTDTAVIVIKVRDEVIVYVPNSFTPDDNGLNDIFLPVLTAGYDRTEGWQFKIYNRWGEEIFNSEIIGNGWDGTYKGEPVQIGSYTWSLRFKDSQNNKIHDFTGHVNLIR